MDIGNLIFGNAFFREFLFYIIVDIEISVMFRCGKVTENHLRRAAFFCFPPYFKYVFRTGSGFACFAVPKHRVDKSLVQSQLSSVIGNKEHIVDIAVHHFVSYSFGSLAKFLHHFLLDFGRLEGNVMIIRLRDRQPYHIRRLNICDIFKHTHQFWQVIKLCKSRFGAVACTLGRKLDCRNGFAEIARPRIKVLQSMFLQSAILQVSLYGIKLHH